MERPTSGLREACFAWDPSDELPNPAYGGLQPSGGELLDDSFRDNLIVFLFVTRATGERQERQGFGSGQKGMESR